MTLALHQAKGRANVHYYLHGRVWAHLRHVTDVVSTKGQGWNWIIKLLMMWHVKSGKSVQQWQILTEATVSRSFKTWDAEPMLVQCWASVADGDPAPNQHWLNVSYFPGVILQTSTVWDEYPWRGVRRLTLHLTSQDELCGGKFTSGASCEASSSKLHVLAQCCINTGTPFATL